MAKRIQTPTSTVNGNPAFPQLTVDDISKIGDYAQESSDAIVAAFVPKPGGEDPVWGGNLVLTGGLSFDIYPPLSVFRATDGKEFTLMQSTPQAFSLQTADATNPRIDIVYATLQESIDAAQITRHYKVDPTNPTSQEGDVSVFSEKWDQVALGVATGTPAVSPLPPALPLNSVPLWTITLNPNETNLANADVVDSRHVLETLEELGDDIAALQAAVNSLKATTPRVPADHVDVLPGAGSFSGQTAQDVFAILANLSNSNNFDPITRPEIITSDGRVSAIPNQDSLGNPVIDIPTGVQVAFSNAVRTITQNNLPASLNPQLVNVDSNAGQQTVTNPMSPLGLGLVTSITAGGGGDWIQKAARLTNARNRPAVAARDQQFIEIFGGQGPSSSNGNLSDWMTYDTQADQITARSFIGVSPPASDNPAMFTCGDGVHVLIGTASQQNVLVPRWFLLNAVSGVCQEVFGGPVTFSGQNFQGFIGDLVSPGVIIVLAQGPGNDNHGTIIRQMWRFDFTAHLTDPTQGTFSQQGSTGMIPGTGFPGSTIGDIDACVYQAGTLGVFCSSRANKVSGQTFLFNLGSTQWSQLSIAQPYNAATTDQSPVANGFKLRNFGGKLYLVGGTQGTTIQTYFWQLTPGTNPSWQLLPSATLPAPSRWYEGLASTLVGGLSTGSGFMFGGGQGNPANDVWEFVQGGIIQTVYNGVSGITLAPGTQQATFTLADFPLPWQVGSIITTLSGLTPPGTVKLSYSFDGGLTFTNVVPDHVTTITGANPSSPRKLSITLINQGSLAPILTGITELFEQVAGPHFNQLFIRISCPAGTRGLYMNRDGSMLVDPNINQTTPDKALLIKTTLNASGPPSVKNYRNRRVLMVKYTGQKTGSPSPVFDNDFAVLPVYVNAIGITGGFTGAVYKITDPTVTFDQPVTVGGLSAVNDTYQVTFFA